MTAVDARARRLRVAGGTHLSVAAVLASLLVAGCTSEGAPGTSDATGSADQSQIADGGPAEQYQPAGGSPGSESTRTMPLDAYIFGPGGQAQGSVDTQAQWVLARTCLQRFGLDFTPPRPDPSPESWWDHPLGVESESDAKDWGYGGKPVEAVPEEEVPADVKAVAFGNSGLTSFAGQPVPAKGCFGEAGRELAKGLPPVADEQYALKLANQAEADAQRDPRLRKAYAGWSRCMKKAGYDYATPLDPPQDERFAPTAAEMRTAAGAATPGQPAPADPAVGEAGAPGPLEIATAVADVACKHQTGVVDTWLSVVREYQQNELDKNAAALAELKTALDARYKRAAEIVNGG